MLLSLGTAAAGAWGVAVAAPQSTAEPERTVSWNEDVRPILAEHCLQCHGPDPATREADLRLDTPEGLRADLGGYAAVVPGEPEESELLYRVTTDDARELMPPADHAEPLTADEVNVLRRWIEEGAEWQAHAAYAPFREVAIPQTSFAVANPIDAFVRARLEAAGRKPAPPATPGEQLRRVHLDLTGLPPSPEQLAAFAADSSDEAYAAVVDSLLASPQFAVRWARQWLDLARYADSHGFTIDGGRSIWPWRDWVVDAIHSDLPFDQFTIDQLAGDLLPDATRAQRIATGFHRNTQINQEGGAKDEENRVNAVLDRVNTTGAVWLGATMACAQCHTHKYDPITQDEYFQLYAFFNQTRDSGVSSAPSVLVARNDKEEAAALAWERELERRRQAVVESHRAATAAWDTWQPRAWGSNGPELRPEEDGSYRVVGQNPVYTTYFLQGEVEQALSAVRLEALPAAGLSGGGPGRANNGNFVLQQVRLFVRPAGEASQEWMPLQLTAPRADLEQDTTAEGGRHYAIADTIDSERAGWAIKPGFGQPHVAAWSLAEPLPPGAWELRFELQQEHGDRHALGAFRVMLTAEPAESEAAAGVDPELVDPAWAQALAELRHHESRPPSMPRSLVMEAREVPRQTRLFGRGSFLDLRHEVEPGFPEAFNHFAPDAPARDRLDLARWLVDPRNALVHRVTVNRWWQQLFGTGLVQTENDFGLRGARPSHPDLLEWLAQDFVAAGMSRKHVIRQIVLSHTYRQSSRVDAAAWERDPLNRELARQRRLRLEGEVVRDAALAVSGLLDETLGGSPVQPPQPDGVFAFTQSRKNWQASEGSARFRRSLYTRIWRSSPFPFYAVFDAPAASAACTRRTRSNTALQALTLANDPMMLEIAAGLGERLAAVDQPFAAAFRIVLGREASAAERERLAAHWQQVAETADADAAWTAVARVLLNLDEFVNRP